MQENVEEFMSKQESADITLKLMQDNYRYRDLDQADNSWKQIQVYGDEIKPEQILSQNQNSWH